MRIALILAAKDLRLLMRDRIALFWVFAFPVLFGAFLGAVLHATIDQRGAAIDLVVVDHSGSPASRSLVAAVGAAEGVAAVTRSEVDAAREVQLGRAAAMLVIPDDFARTTGAPPRVELRADPSRAAERVQLHAKIAAVAPDALGVPPALPALLVEAREIDAGGRALPQGAALVFPAAVLWGLMGCAATFAVSLVAERQRGTLARLRASPISVTTILASKALSCLAACLTTSALLVALGSATAHVETASPAKLVLAVVSAATCFVGLTILLSVLGKSEQSVAGAGWAVLIVMAMVGGAMVPLGFMPESVRAVGQVSPVRWAILALEGATWRAHSWVDLARSCTVLLAVGCASLLLGVQRLRTVKI